MVFSLGFLLSIVALFLILLVLIQRGKGADWLGWLAGWRGERVRHQGRRPVY